MGKDNFTIDGLKAIIAALRESYDEALGERTPLDGRSQEEMVADADQAWRTAAGAEGTCKKKPRDILHLDGNLGFLSRIFIVFCVISEREKKNHVRVSKGTFFEVAARRVGLKYSNFSTNNYLSLGNAGSTRASRVGPAIKGMADWLNQLAGASVVTQEMICDCRFDGEDPVQSFIDTITGENQNTQPLAGPRIISAKRLEKIIPADSDFCQSILKRISSSASDHPMLTNISAQDAWFELAAMSDRLFDLISANEPEGGRPVLHVTLGNYGRKIEQDDAPALSFPELFAVLRTFYFDGMTGITQGPRPGMADFEPLSEKASLADELQLLRIQMAERPGIVIIDGLYVDDDARNTGDLERLVSDRVTLSLLRRLLEPPISSVEPGRLIDDYSRNHFIVLSNRELPATSGWMRVPKISQPSIENLGAFEKPLTKGLREEEVLPKSAELRRMVAGGSFSQAPSSVLVALDVLDEVCDSVSLKGRTAAFDRVLDGAPVTNRIFEKCVDILNEYRPEWVRMLFILLLSPDGLRRDTARRAIRQIRSARLGGRGFFDGMPDLEVDEILDQMLDQMPSLLSGAGPDFFNEEDNLWREAAGAAKRSDLTIVLRQPEWRWPLVKAVAHRILEHGTAGEGRIPADFFHLCHRVLAEEAINQQADALRVGNLASSESLRPWRRHLSAIYHGTQALPLDTNGTDISVRDWKLSGIRLKEPLDPIRFHFWLHDFWYRRILERPPAWNVSRHFGLDPLKVHILSLFDMPWISWPDALSQPFSGLDHGMLALGDDEVSRDRMRAFYVSMSQAKVATENFAPGREAARKSLSSVGGMLANPSIPTAGSDWSLQRIVVQATKRRLDASIAQGADEVPRKELHSLDSKEEQDAVESVLGMSLDKLYQRAGEWAQKIRDVMQSGGEPEAMLPTAAIREAASQTSNAFTKRGVDPKLQSSVCDILFRLAEIKSIVAEVEDAEAVAANYPKGLTRGIKTGFMDLPTHVGEFCEALALFLFAESVRLNVFYAAPLSDSFFASGHATRQMIRTLLHLERIARNTPGSNYGEDGCFYDAARTMADRLAAHLFRYSRERAGMLVLESSFRRILASEVDPMPDLRLAEHYLSLSEPVILGLGRKVSVRKRLALERIELQLAMAMKLIGKEQEEARMRLELARCELSWVFSVSARDSYWRRIAQTQSARRKHLLELWELK